MDEVAQYGVAAHFKYSEEGKSEKVETMQAQWIKKIQTLVQEYQSSEEKEQFKDKLNIEILDKSVFLYTPEGDVIEMPTESTVLDFAFRIHSKLGLSFKNSLVNGEIKPISFIPKTGDLIQINNFKNKFSANKHWLDFLHTPSAKSQLNRYLRQQGKEELISKGIAQLKKQLEHYQLPKYNSTNDKIKKTFSEKELEQKLFEIADKKSNYSQLIKTVYPKERQKKNQERKKPHKDKKHTNQDEIIVDLDKRINYKLCPECNPKPGTQIIARTGKDGIKIHNTQCKAIKSINFSKLLEAHRLKDQASEYKAEIVLHIQNSVNVIDILRLFSDLQINLTQINIKDISNHEKKIILHIRFQHPNKIALLLNDLKKQSNSIKIIRRRFI
ncbi:MAG: bifunctional (p)ppGpp synthetase/guanosine-3',5'-bis(diphosphate) 3'-pyrophosphohydrolase [bacterium]|nr:bifunctional (p)ppGpp synthetase/guanosine-3',5'-bis(diphosphate) 3'-pyrophosphohydrolase [bacterium]